MYCNVVMHCITCASWYECARQLGALCVPASPNRFQRFSKCAFYPYLICPYQSGFLQRCCRGRLQNCFVSLAIPFQFLQVIRASAELGPYVLSNGFFKTTTFVLVFDDLTKSRATKHKDPIQPKQTCTAKTNTKMLFLKSHSTKHKDPIQPRHECIVKNETEIHI